MMTFKEVKDQIDKGYLEWKELLTLKVLFPKYLHNLRHEVIKRNIPWFVPCKDWVAERIEIRMAEEGKV